MKQPTSGELVNRRLAVDGADLGDLILGPGVIADKHHARLDGPPVAILGRLGRAYFRFWRLI